MTAVKDLHANAQQRFTAAIRIVMANMEENGYGHERAVELLLRFFQQNQNALSDSKIFSLMTAKKLTRAEAIKVLIVSSYFSDLKRKQLNEGETLDHVISKMFTVVKNSINEDGKNSSSLSQNIHKKSSQYQKDDDLVIEARPAPAFTGEANSQISVRSKISDHVPSLNAHGSAKTLSKGAPINASFKNINTPPALGKSTNGKNKGLKGRKRMSNLQESSAASPLNSSLEKKMAAVDTVTKKAMLAEEQQQSTRSLSPAPQARKRPHGFSPMEQTPTVNKRARGI